MKVVSRLLVFGVCVTSLSAAAATCIVELQTRNGRVIDSFSGQKCQRVKKKCHDELDHRQSLGKNLHAVCVMQASSPQTDYTSDRSSRYRDRRDRRNSRDYDYSGGNDYGSGYGRDYSRDYDRDYGRDYDYDRGYPGSSEFVCTIMNTSLPYGPVKADGFSEFDAKANAIDKCLQQNPGYPNTCHNHSNMDCAQKSPHQYEQKLCIVSSSSLPYGSGKGQASSHLEAKYEAIKDCMTKNPGYPNTCHNSSNLDCESIGHSSPYEDKWVCGVHASQLPYGGVVKKSHSKLEAKDSAINHCLSKNPGYPNTCHNQGNMKCEKESYKRVSCIISSRQLPYGTGRGEASTQVEAKIKAINDCMQRNPGYPNTCNSSQNIQCYDY